jgi:hypothetical protein
MIGLHRQDKDKEASSSSLGRFAIEHHTRLWSFLCHADATMSYTTDRPLSIQPNRHRVQTIHNISLDELADLEVVKDRTAKIPSRDLKHPTSATYLVFRVKLAEIVARMTDLRGGSQADDYEQVKELDADIQALCDSLPSFFQFGEADTSQDDGT